MGTFNSLFVDRRCPACGSSAEREVQFRFGDTWQYDFRIGDQVPWGGNDRGEPGLSKVHVLGWRCPCPVCGEDEGNCAVVVEDDELVAVDEWQGPMPELKNDTWYVAGAATDSASE